MPLSRLLASRAAAAASSTRARRLFLSSQLLLEEVDGLLRLLELRLHDGLLLLHLLHRALLLGPLELELSLLVREVLVELHEAVDGVVLLFLRAGEELLAPDLVERVAALDQEAAVGQRVAADVGGHRPPLREHREPGRLLLPRRDPCLAVLDVRAQLLEPADGLLVAGRGGVGGLLGLGDLRPGVVDRRRPRGGDRGSPGEQGAGEHRRQGASPRHDAGTTG